MNSNNIKFSHSKPLKGTLTFYSAIKLFFSDLLNNYFIFQIFLFVEVVVVVVIVVLIMLLLLKIMLMMMRMIIYDNDVDQSDNVDDNNIKFSHSKPLKGTLTFYSAIKLFFSDLLNNYFIFQIFLFV